MRLLANDWGPAKIGFLPDPSPSRKNPAVLDRLVLRADIRSISDDSRSTLLQVQVLSPVIILNDRTSDFLTERLRKNASTLATVKRTRVSLLGSANRFVTL